MRPKTKVAARKASPHVKGVPGGRRRPTRMQIPMPITSMARETKNAAERFIERSRADRRPCLPRRPRRPRERREALGLGTGGSDAPPPSGDAPPPSSEPSPPVVVAAADTAPGSEDGAPVGAEAEPAAALPTYVAPRGPRSGIPVWMFP